MTSTGITPTRLIALLCGGLGVAVSASRLASAAPRVRLLETGDFHGDEVRARTGEQWLGLYVSRAESVLAPSRVRVRRVQDLVVDENSGEKTGKKVTVQRRPDPIFLLRGAAMLRPGKVITVHRHETSLANHADIPLKLAGTLYHLRVVSRHRSHEEVSPDARLVLSSGKARQTLYSLVGRESDLWGGEWNLVWAGDLDHDGKLDLCVEVSDNYNMSQRKLFLSSQARKGRLVREIAEFITAGC